MPRSLETVVTSVATQLMAVNAATSVEVSTSVLADLVSYFDVDVSFLRHNDHKAHVTKLVAEWPPRPVDVHTDPLAVIHFADADPVFAMSENYKEPAVFRPNLPPRTISARSRPAVMSRAPRWPPCRCFPKTSRRGARLRQIW